MQTWESILSNYSGSFPDVLAIDASGAGLTDGTEIIAALMNNTIMSFPQALMDYASGSANAPTGTPGTPNGVADAAGVSQLIEAIQVAHGLGPGIRVPWDKADSPATLGHRVLLLSNQGVLRATYPELDAAVYVGDGNNATAAYYFHADNSDGSSRNTAGVYLILPPQPAPTYFKQYEEGNTYNGVALTVTGTNWTTSRGVFVPYKTVDGTSRLVFNISGNFSVSTTTGTISIAGIVFYTTGGPTGGQSVSQAIGLINRVDLTAIAVDGTGNISGAASTVGNAWNFSGNVELDSWPTWADDFEFVWGITY